MVILNQLHSLILTKDFNVNGAVIAFIRDHLYLFIGIHTVSMLFIMEKEGLISIGEGRLPQDFWNLPRPKDAEGSVLKALIEEREEGR